MISLIGGWAAWLRVHCLSILIVCLGNAVSAQEHASGYVEDFRDIYSVASDGSLNRTRQVFFRIKDGSQLLALLQDPYVSDDIGLVPSQGSELESLKAVVASHRHLFNQPRTLRGREKWVAEIEHLSQEFQTAMGELLTQDQLTRLRQLMIHGQVNRSSLLEQLVRGELGKQCGVDHRTRCRLLKLVDSEAERILSDCQEFQKRQLKRILDILDDEQRQQLGRFFEGHESVPLLSPLDVFAHQCKCDGLSEFSKDIPARFRKYGFLLEAPSYEVGPNGQLGILEKETNENDLLWVFQGLLAELSRESQAIENNIVDEQREAIALEKEEFNRFTDALIAQQTELVDAGLFKASDQKEYVAEIAGYLEDAIGRLDRILIVEQVEHLHQRSLRTKLLQAGLGYCLVEGELGRKVRLSHVQREMITDVCRHIILEYKEFSEQAKKEHDRTIRSVLPKSVAQKLQELLGDPPARDSFAIEALGLKLSQLN